VQCGAIFGTRLFNLARLISAKSDPEASSKEPDALAGGARTHAKFSTDLERSSRTNCVPTINEQHSQVAQLASLTRSCRNGATKSKADASDHRPKASASETQRG
jgi:hypothetical protein